MPRIPSGDLLADDGDAGLDLRDARCGPVACGLGRCSQFAEAALGRCDGAFEPLVGAIERDEDGDALVCHLRFFSYRKWYGMPQAAVESGRRACRSCAFGHHTVFLRSAIRASTRRFLARTSGPAGETDGGSPQPRSDVAVRLLCPEAPGLVTRRMGEVAFACHSYTAKKMAPASGIRRNSASVPPGTRTFSQPACCYPHRLWPLGFMVAYRLLQDYVPSPYPMSERVNNTPLLIVA
ncbi:AI-2E family transporter [Ralstonia solanacearum]|nr:AI-2E family transporter [Ralstonia solanacearum]